MAIVAGHVWDNQFTREGIYTWHVPLFFFLTGYLWAARRPLQTEVGKRTRTLLVPYMCWLVVISVPYIGLSVFKDSKDPWPLVLEILWGGSNLGRPYSAFWFVTALFFAALFLRSLQRLPAWASWVIALGGLAICYANSSVASAFPLSVGIAVPAMLFVLLGSAFRAIRPRMRYPLSTGIALLGLSTVLVLFGWSAPLDMKQADFGTPIVSVVVATAISAGLLLVAERTITWTGHAAAWTIKLAATGFMVVLTHAAVLWLLRTPPTGSWLDFGLALTVPWLAAILVSFTGLSAYLLGVAPPKARHRLTSPRTSDAR